MTKKAVNFFILICTLSIALPLHASLLISPTRLILDEKSRTANVILMNSGTEIQSYRLSWKEMTALPEGGYRELTPQEVLSFPSLSRTARLSPKQVTLKPGESQTVKVSVRRPRTSESKEFRSHLKFTLLPKIDIDAAASTTASVKINMLLSYTIPVIYRMGEFSYGNRINNISLKHDKKNNKATIKVDLEKAGNFSLTGNLYAFWKPHNSNQETKVGILNGFNFYHELDHVSTNILWENFKLAPGTLRVVYDGKQEFSGTQFSTYSLVITPKMVHSLTN